MESLEENCASIRDTEEVTWNRRIFLYFQRNFDKWKEIWKKLGLKNLFCKRTDLFWSDSFGFTTQVDQFFFEIDKYEDQRCVSMETTWSSFKSCQSMEIYCEWIVNRNHNWFLPGREHPFSIKMDGWKDWTRPTNFFKKLI